MTRHVTDENMKVTQQPTNWRNQQEVNTSTTSNPTSPNTTAAMTTTTAIRYNPASEAYRKSVKLCIVRGDGSAEIHHHDGRVERIGANERPVRNRAEQKSGTEGVTVVSQPATPLMKKIPIMKITSIATLLLSAFATSSKAEPDQTVAGQGLVAAIIDDQTGEELAVKHGIKALALADLSELIKAVLNGDRPATLVHLAVDDDASDNPIGRLSFAPYGGPKPPRAPSPTLPMRQLAAATEDYKRDRTEWQRGISAYRLGIVENANGFIHQVAATQLQIAQRFDDMLADRNGRDFNRSDIVGCITTANRLLGKGERRVLILNTDAKDLPANRKPRQTALTKEELDPAVELVFVNTSHLPQQEPLFRGIPNRIHEVPSMKSALALVAEMLAGDDDIATK